MVATLWYNAGIAKIVYGNVVPDSEQPDVMEVSVLASAEAAPAVNAAHKSCWPCLLLRRSRAQKSCSLTAAKSKP